MNVELLRIVQEKIREEPARANMGTWETRLSGEARKFYGLLHSPAPPCNTIACIGGWALISAGKPVRSADGEPWENASTLLGLDARQAARLFYAHNWPSAYLTHINAPGTPAYAADVIARIDHFIATEGRE